MYDAQTVANYVIKYANKKGIPLTKYRLPKILFYVQVVFLCEYERPLFKDKIKKGRLGVFIEDVGQRYLFYDLNEQIKEPERQVELTFRDNGGFLLRPAGVLIPEKSYERALIEQVLDVLSLFEDDELIESIMSLEIYKKDKERIHSGETIYYDEFDLIEEFKNKEELI